jgi:hypothetical protein
MLLLKRAVDPVGKPHKALCVSELHEPERCGNEDLIFLAAGGWSVDS